MSFLTNTKKDLKYILPYFLYALIPLIVLLCSGEFENIYNLLSIYFFLITLFYILPISIFIFTANIDLTETGVQLKILGIGREILYSDIESYVENDGRYGGSFFFI